jgi:hypothetical protein
MHDPKTPGEICAIEKETLSSRSEEWGPSHPVSQKNCGSPNQNCLNTRAKEGKMKLRID